MTEIKPGDAKPGVPADEHDAHPKAQPPQGDEMAEATPPPQDADVRAEAASYKKKRAEEQQKLQRQRK